MRKTTLSTLLLLSFVFCGCSNSSAPTPGATSASTPTTAEVADAAEGEVTEAQAQEHLIGCKSNLKNLGTALEMYSTDYAGHYPAEQMGLEKLTPNYLKTLPACPAAGKVTYSYDEGMDAEFNSHGFQDYYVMHCQGGHHTAAGVEGDLPAYTGVVGLIDNQQTLQRVTEEAEQQTSQRSK